MRVGATPIAQGDTGHLWVLLLDSAFANVGQTDLNPVGGPYANACTAVVPGDYYLVAGTDSANDSSICDPGQACGAYPTLGVSTPATATSSRSDPAFTVTFGSALGSAATAGAASGLTRLQQARGSPERRRWSAVV